MPNTEAKSPNRYNDSPRDKPQGERVEHANLDRPGAQAHPRAGRAEWTAYADRAAGWKWN